MGAILAWLGKSRRETIPYADPLRAGRHPFQTYLLALCVISGLPLLFGKVTAGSIEEQLHPYLALAWGAFLFLGSITALTGSYWPGDYANALTIERMGLLIAGSAGIAYALVVMATVPPLDGLTAGAIVLGFGASCVVRAHDIGKIMRRAAEVNSATVAREGESDLHAALRDPDEGEMP